MIDAVSEKLVLGTGGGAPPTAPSSDTAGSLLTEGEARTHPGDDGVPTATECQYNEINGKISVTIADIHSSDFLVFQCQLLKERS